MTATAPSPSISDVGDDFARGRAEVRAVGADAADIAGELSKLAALEAALARAEVMDNVDTLKRGGIWGAVGAVVGFWVLGFLALAMTFALAEIWPAWLAALATALSLLAIAGIALAMAKARLQAFSPVPGRAIESIRKDVQWARELTKRSGR